MIFKNKASRPYSFHLQGVYDRSQAAGITQTQASSAPPGAPGDPVPPGEARTYTWKIAKNQGPKKDELDCKAGAYYSTVDKVCTGLHLYIAWTSAVHLCTGFKFILMNTKGH